MRKIATMKNTGKKHSFFLNHFTKGELILWFGSVSLILLSFIIFDREGYVTLFSSLLAVTSLVYVAKGDPIGQILLVFFIIFYAIVSLSYRYYGEVITYVCMSFPMSVLSLVSWFKNTCKGNKRQVKIGQVGKKELSLLLILAIAVSVLFYFILGALDTKNLLVSTFSVTTSFSAAYLTYRRSPLYALAYAANDVVLIVLWALATVDNIKYLSMVICFIAFLANDLYGFFNWKRMEKNQAKKSI